VIENPGRLLTFLIFTVATKASSSPPDATPVPTFEAAMQRLDTIVDAMESGDTPLAELLAQFEEGSKLLAQCEQRLKAAELKIEQLKRQKDGTTVLEPFPHDRAGA
jgi:exodeoxyribonuclease VII small subunit